MVTQMEVRQVLERLEAYTDDWNVLVHAVKNSGEQGDSANRTMAAYVYMKTLNQLHDYQGHPIDDGYQHARASFEYPDKPGRYSRHPDHTRWFGNINNMSRDQSIVIQSAMISFHDDFHAMELLQARSQRLLFHFNSQSGDDTEPVKNKFPDPPAPIEISQFIRALGWKWLYPVLLITDLQLVVDVAVVRPITKWQGNKDFDVQYLPILLSAQSRMKTPWTYLAKLIYGRTKDVQTELRRYFAEGPGLNGLEPLGELACLAYRKGILDEK